MNTRKYLFHVLIILLVLCLTSVLSIASESSSGKKKIMVVSSYHRDYSWSQETNAGLCAAMLKFGYLDNEDQTDEFTRNDYIETSKAIVKKYWMDTKRKKSKEEIARITLNITKDIEEFKPDILLLGDDNAARYIGNQFLDTEIPIVFWGVNNTPVKYGLVDSIENPGHNVTGIYQPGYKVESLKLLKSIVPNIKTFAILSDETTSGRNHVKALEHLARKNMLPVKLVETVTTNNYELWKARALKLQKKVDAFFVTQYSGLKDEKGNYISAETAAEWYLTHIDIPEAVDQGQFVKMGMLCGVNDAGYNHGFEALVIAHDILENGLNPSTYPTRPPHRGALMVNKKRAKMFGFKLTEDMGIEEYVE